MARIAVAYGSPGTIGRRGWNWCLDQEMVHTGVPADLPAWRFAPLGIQRSFVGCFSCKGTTHARVVTVTDIALCLMVKRFLERFSEAWPDPWLAIRKECAASFAGFLRRLEAVPEGTILTVKKGEGWGYAIRRVQASSVQKFA